MSRTSTYILLIVGAVAAVAGASARIVTATDETQRGSESQDLGRPAFPSPKAVERLRRAVSPWAKRCEARPAPGHERFFARLDATARLECDNPAEGVRTLAAYQFGSRADFDADLSDVRNFLPLAAGSCDDAPGRTFWTDRKGVRRGSIVCGRVDDFDYIVWTDDRARRRFLVSGPERTPLHEWWAKTIRPQGRYPTHAESRLLGLVARELDGDSCRRELVDSPMSQAALSCDGARSSTGGSLRANHIEFSLYSGMRDVRARIQADADAFAPRVSYSRHRPTYLNTLGTSYSFWRSVPSNRREGDLLLFPYNGITWLSWTVESAKLYGRVGRGDQDPARTFDAFVRLGRIGLGR